MTGQRREGQRSMENVRKLFHHGQHTPLCKQSFWAKTTFYIFKKKVMKCLLRPGREQTMVLFYNPPKFSTTCWQLEGKPFVLALSKCQFPSWSRRSLNCCQKQEIVCHPLCPGIRPCPDPVPFTVNQPALSAWLVSEKPLGRFSCCVSISRAFSVSLRSSL